MRMLPLRAVSFVSALSLLLPATAPCLSPGSAAVDPVGQTAAATAQAPKSLFIEILQGEGEMNDIRARTAREPIVQVRDENHKPVAGALVLFAVDTNNGGLQRASFSNHASSVSVRTDSNGQASAQSFEVLKKAGQVRILVRVVLGAAVAEAVITETNYVPGGKFHRTVTNHKVLLGAAAVAAVVAVVVALDTGGSGTTITAGTGVVRGIVHK